MPRIVAKVTFGGVQYDLPHYTLGILRDAAPFLDRMQEIAGASAKAVQEGELVITKPSNALEMFDATLGFFWAGIHWVNPEISYDWLLGEVTPEEIDIARPLMNLVREAAGASGEGEPKAQEAAALPQPSNKPPRPAVRSSSKSRKSSASSSAPA